MGADGDLFESLRMELRRGSLTLGVLVRLRQERYGYTLRQALAADGLEMEESTLYPLLRRLEAQGLLVSEWREEEKRKKRFYRLSADGETMLGRLLAEWRAISASLEKIIEP
ncbi:MAG: helix-turn-helix transcriptional regulator [Phenylobacterium sp.]|nr:helix-turn-helix transcriptional regulator [Phenylobacterium sp.]MBP7650258.1 helix-turn-helix transcriptional regulator [Phenylobacterium sp.]MBP8246821.1 helix-turn-helix transcriptional regulator [Phenylobacterium sp.]